ncbi:MAG: flotillin-like protein FloA [Planctomycetes bacterium]|nr:flotillin-like protein FloA [Planctomycetota bacterium]
MSEYVWIGAGVLAALLLIVAFFVILNFGRLWLQAKFSQTPLSFFDLLGMAFRKVNSSLIVNSKIQAHKAGLTDITTEDLEAHYLARGRVPNVIVALISAQRANIPLDFRTACAIDLAGRDIVDAVNTSVNPKVIDCPAGGGAERLDAVSKDGIRLLAKARVTVRTNIQQLVGGATEDTVVARVGQAIVSAIGSSADYKTVLENPDKIAKRALDSGLGAGTAFSILSIDIADISVAGVSTEANVGAKLQAEQAEADKRRFQAEAEKRRAMATAREQEMVALVQENRAKVVLAEAEIPKAMAEAFRNGNFGIMDYYRMKNIQADTGMRDSIAKPGERNRGAPPTDG